MKLIQITDIHYVHNGNRLHGLDPYERLESCIADINANHADADLCIITGDLAHNGLIETYENLRDRLRTLSISYHFMIGNHDNRENFHKVFPGTPCDESGFLQSVVDTAAGRFILLDTVEQGRNWGSYCEKRRKWLQAQLEASGERTVYLFMHHPPFKIGLPCLDRIRLIHDGDYLRKIIEPHKNIQHIFLGHVHRPVAGSWRGIPFSMLRGTNHQVPFDFDAVEVVPKSHEPPAYAVIFLEPEQTTVHFHDYLDNTVYPYEPKS
jgi:3',5'-cyclic AMP phosphodiesterase CpdA